MHGRTASLPLLALLAGCHSGSDAPRISSEVRNITFPQAISGDVTLSFDLVDDPPKFVDLSVEVSRDGGASYAPARIFGPTTDLTATPNGTHYTVVWDSLADAGFRSTTGVTLRFSVANQSGRSRPFTQLMPVPDNRALAVRAVQSYFIHYGPFDAATEATAQTHDLVIVHPSNGAVGTDTVRRIQQGVLPNDPADDVMVLAYISIGEDLRTIGKTDAELLLDPRFVGDATGPRVDPRGPDADGDPLTGIDPLGLASNGGTGFASWYLDDNSIDRDPGNVGDGLPDRNAHFGGCFVNAGDPAWFDVLDAMTIDGVDANPGMRELLTDFGRGYGCDGLFLDTIDTCAPNFFTDSNSGNQSEFEWTAPGFTDFMRRIQERYPDSLVLQNRGLFFYDPRKPHYQVNPRSYTDFVLFESYRLNSNGFEEFHEHFFPDNKHNVAPKLMAEANRPDGFRVLSLGYAEGPASGMDKLTLVGGSTLGLQSLLEDIRESEDLAGFRHYITDAGVVFPNTFVRENRTTVDTTAPVWSSTFNDNANAWPVPAGAPTPRIGIQEVAAGPDCATVRWDVALDLNRVSYVLYYATGLDFIDLAAATRVDLVPMTGDGYDIYSGYPHQATVTGLTTGTSYEFCIRAIDELGNEDQNEATIWATPFGQATITIDGSFGDWAGVPLLHQDPADVPASAGPDWLDVQIANDATWLSMRFTSDDPFNLNGSPSFGFSRTLVFIDVDDNAGTGYSVTDSVGAELVVAGDGLHTLSDGAYNATFVSTITVAPVTNVTEWELAIPLSQIYAANPNASRLRIALVNDDASDYAPDSGAILYTIAPP